MTVYSLKPGFQGVLRPFASRWVTRGGTANHLTAAGLGVAALTGIATALGSQNARWLLAVPALLLSRMAFNALDGIVAREHDQASAGGRLFNEMADVAGDTVAYLPLALVLPSDALVVVAVVILALLTEFAAVLDPICRRNEGPMGKSDRAVAIGAIALLIGAGVPAGAWTTVALIGVAAALTLTVRNRLRETS